MKQNNIISTVRLTAATLALFCGTAALAQQSSDDGFDKPLNGSRSEVRKAQTQSTVKIVKSDGDRKIEIEIRNGNVAAKVNGEKVPADRIVLNDKTVTINDESGKAIETIDLPEAPASNELVAPRANRQRENIARSWTWSTPGQGGIATTAPQGNPPRVMLGITMSENTTDDEFTCKIESLVPGQPAEKAGLKVDDEILAIDGKPLTEAGALRAALKDKNPGDTAEITIVRDGKEQKIKVDLAAFDATKLPAGRSMGSTLTPTPSGADHFNEARKEIEAARAAFEKVSGNEEARKQATAALDKALAALEEAKASSIPMVTFDNNFPGNGQNELFDEESNERIQKLVEEMSRRYGNNGQRRVLTPEGRVFVMPQAPAAPDAPAMPSMPGMMDNDERLEKLGSALERLERKIESLEKQLEKSPR